ncbi:Aspartate/glutamate/uridylate kinase [Chytridium lagenaria]|nr:Aspartate/glutamate/uridylate kinase [Chytridium lagenaria]
MSTTSPSHPQSALSWLILRFDGSTLGTSDRLMRVARLIKSATSHHNVAIIVEGMRMPVVGSTRARLTKIIRMAVRATHSRYIGRIAELEKDHVQLLRRAVKDCRYWDDAERGIMMGLYEVRELLNAVRVIGEIPPKSSDLILSAGDRMAARIVVAALQSLNVPATYIDASKMADPYHPYPVTDEFYQDVAGRVSNAVQTANNEGCVAVVTGCFGPFPSPFISPTKHTVRRIPLNHHVTALYTADPRIVPNARKIHRLTPDEAGELSLMGVGAHLVGLTDASIVGVDDVERWGNGEGWTALVHRDEVTVFTIKASGIEKEEEGGGGTGNSDTLRMLPEVMDVVDRRGGVVCAVVMGLKSISLGVAVKDPEILDIEGDDDDDEDDTPRVLKSKVTQAKRDDHILADMSTLPGIGVTMRRDVALLTLIGRRRQKLGSLEMRGRRGSGISVVVDKEKEREAVTVVHDTQIMTLAESPPWSPSTNLSLSDSAIAVEPVDDAWIIVRMDGVTIGCWDGMRRVAMMVK